MNVKMAKRLLSGALAVVLTLAPNMGVFAATAKGTVSGETATRIEFESFLVLSNSKRKIGRCAQVVKAYAKVRKKVR